LQLSWALSYPIDVIKTRLQADTAGTYRNARHALSMSVQQHGYRILFQGFGACMYRAFLVNAVTFVAFEEARRRLSI
jgi:solute carrier family 25 (mitochondrial carnitine/acylcarnitine transporter), member 20/29